MSDRVAIVGVAHSTKGRRLGLSSRQLAVQAAKAAMADAGMGPGDIDGSTMLWTVDGPQPPGLDVVDSMDLAYMLGIGPLNWWASFCGPSYIGAAVQAVAAIRSGFCHTVLTTRVVRQIMSVSELLTAEPSARLAADDLQFSAPFGSVWPAQSIAGLAAQRHMDVYGTTEEDFGRHVIAQREWASHNPDAIHRTPLTMDDYLNSPYISTPVRVLDCDYPVDSASSVIYTTEERAHSFAKKPIFVESAAFSSVKYATFEYLDDLLDNAPEHCSKTLWERTTAKPSDLDLVGLYDGFTIIVFRWLEALGICPRGDAGRYISDGHTAVGGKLPLNTDGGACNVGQHHGANFCIESVRQLRGDESGNRQIPGAELALWTNAVGPYAGAMILAST